MSDKSDIDAEIERRVAEAQELVRNVAKKYIGQPLDKEKLADQIVESLTRSSVGKTRREDDGTPIFDPLTCITAWELRKMGFALDSEIPDVGWVPRESITWNVSNNMTDEEVKAGKLKISLGPKFTEAFVWVEVDFAISPADDLKELDE